MANSSKSLFKYYREIGGFTFGVVGISNFTTSMINKNRRDIFINNPQIATTALVLKSMWFGLLWPAFFIMALTKPDETFILGRGFEKDWHKFKKEIEQIDQNYKIKKN